MNDFTWCLLHCIIVITLGYVRTTGVVFPARKGFFLFATVSKPELRPIQLPTQWVMEVSFLDEKRPEY